MFIWSWFHLTHGPPGFNDTFGHRRVRPLTTMFTPLSQVVGTVNISIPVAKTWNKTKGCLSIFATSIQTRWILMEHTFSMFTKSVMGRCHSCYFAGKYTYSVLGNVLRQHCTEKRGRNSNNFKCLSKVKSLRNNVQKHTSALFCTLLNHREGFNVCM